MVGGSSFDPVSVDLAEYSDIWRDPETVHFVGSELLTRCRNLAVVWKKDEPDLVRRSS